MSADIGASSSGDSVEHPITISTLPPEVLMKIFSFLDCSDLLCSVRYVNHEWEKASKSSLAWHSQIYTIGAKRYISGLEPFGHYHRELQKSILLLREFCFIRHIKAYRLSTTDTEMLMKVMAKYCENLHSVKFVDCYMRNRKLLKKLFLKFQNIETFSICLNSKIAQECINALGGCSNLRYVTLRRYCRGMNKVLDLKPIADGCPKLTHLRIRLLTYEADDMVYLLRQTCDHLKSIEFSGDFIRNDTVLPFRQCKSLEYIYCTVSSRPFTLKFLEKIGSAPALKKLSLCQYRCRSLSVFRDFFLSKIFPNIIELELVTTVNINKELAVILKWSVPNLRKLRLSWQFSVAEQEVAEVFHLKNLQFLELRGCNSFPNEWVKELEKCKRLEFLSFRNCHTLNNSQLVAITSRLDLEALCVRSCRMLTDFALQYIAMCTSLKYIVLDSCYFSGNSVVKMLSKMNVSVISVFNCINITRDDVNRMKKYVDRVDHNY